MNDCCKKTYISVLEDVIKAMQQYKQFSTDDHTRALQHAIDCFQSIEKDKDINK